MLQNTMKYPIICLVGMQCAGKDTIQSIIAKDMDMNIIVSHTNRPMRSGEVDGREYNFVTKQQMITAIKKGGLIEYREYQTLVDNVPDTWYYGIHKNSIKNSDKQNNIVIVDPSGAESLTSYFGKENVITIFISSDDEDRLERCKRRGSYNEAEWDRRESADYNKFIIYSNQCDYLVINMEDNIHECVKTIKNYIEFENSMRAKNFTLEKIKDFIFQIKRK